MFKWWWLYDGTVKFKGTCVQNKDKFHVYRQHFVACDSNDCNLNRYSDLSSV